MLHIVFIIREYDCAAFVIFSPCFHAVHFCVKTCVYKIERLVLYSIALVFLYEKEQDMSRMK